MLTFACKRLFSNATPIKRLIATPPFKAAKVVEFDFQELLDIRNDVSKRIEEAYGDNGLGIAIVNNVPGFTKIRENILPLGHKLASLPKRNLEALERPDHFHALGWSHGKEQFYGKYDFAKGSFYANCSDDIRVVADRHMKHVPLANPWPRDTLPELEYAFKAAGKKITQTGAVLARQLDKYVKQRNPDYQSGWLERIIETGEGHIGRLLHYFPMTSKDNTGEEAMEWCGWHNDHSAFTGLMPAMFIDKHGEETSVDDKESGLLIYSRDEQVFKAKIPPTAIAYQIGETLQVVTGGELQATPHCVVTSQKLIDTGISRNTLAVFMSANDEELMSPPNKKDIPRVLSRQPNITPRLQDRWIPNEPFKTFGAKTMAYYS